MTASLKFWNRGNAKIELGREGSDTTSTIAQVPAE
jgi:hypothetical protein